MAPANMKSKSINPPIELACPCGTAASYAACCGRYLEAGQRPATAEALMRSRYVAYVQGRADYLWQTRHPSTRPVTLDLKGEPSTWLGLKVLRVEAGGSEDVQGLVEFVARYKRERSGAPTA